MEPLPALSGLANYPSSLYVSRQRLEFFLDTSFTTRVARLSRWTRWSTWCCGRWTNWTKFRVILQISFLASFAVVYGLHDLRSGGQTTLFMATAYNALQVRSSLSQKVTLFQRLAWGFSLAWVIFSCTKVAIESSIWSRGSVLCQGYGGPVNDFLSWSAFAPLARLTYCCYLIHMEVLPMFVFSVLTFPNDVSLAVQIFSSQVFAHRSAFWVLWCTSSGASPSPSPLPSSWFLLLKFPSPEWRRFWWVEVSLFVQSQITTRRAKVEGHPNSRHLLRLTVCWQSWWGRSKKSSLLLKELLWWWQIQKCPMSFPKIQEKWKMMNPRLTMWLQLIQLRRRTLKAWRLRTLVAEVTSPGKARNSYILTPCAECRKKKNKFECTNSVFYLGGLAGWSWWKHQAGVFFGERRSKTTTDQWQRKHFSHTALVAHQWWDGLGGILLPHVPLGKEEARTLQLIIQSWEKQNYLNWQKGRIATRPL